MLTIKRNPKVLPQNVGEFISESTFLNLSNDFVIKYPNEIPSVTISKDVIEDLLAKDDISGIRFMYGINDVDDPASRLIVLMPCNYTMSGTIPNIVFDKDGFQINSGEKISFDKTWQVLFNHVTRYRKIDNITSYTKIIRGCFFGKKSLLKLLSQTEENKIIFHFGYDSDTLIPFQPILQPIDKINVYMDRTIICPPDCDPDSCIASYVANVFEKHAENSLNTLRSFRTELLNEHPYNGFEVEKYYTISASIMEYLKNDTQNKIILKNIYDKYFKLSLNYLEANDKENAFQLFKECMQYLGDKYLFQ